MDLTNFTLLTCKSSSGLLSNSETETGLLSNNNDFGNTSMLTVVDSNNGLDAFGGKDFFGTPDFSNLNENFFASVPQTETAGSVAYNTAETVGSVAYSTAETVGSVACASVGASFSSDCGGSSFSSVC